MKIFIFINTKIILLKIIQDNRFLKDKIEWKLNLLWCEKCYFVKEIIDNDYFKGDYFGWCDIGYFRDKTAENWPSNLNLEDKIYYNSVSNYRKIRKINGAIDGNQNSICGGFFCW